MKAGISFSKGFFPLLLSSLLMVLCLTGCAEDSNILDNGGNRQLEFSVKTCGWNNSNSSSNSKKDSRATPISGNTFDTSRHFNVIADENKGNSWSTEVNNETVSYSSENKIWQTPATHYWPESGSTVNFYAYYPTSISGSITHATGSVPVLSYTVPDNAADQIDILASSKTGVAEDSYNQTSVDFKHIFAAVQFQVGSSGLPSGTISSITISGIKNSGTYTFGSGWTLNSNTKTFTVSPSTVINGTSGESIATGIYTFLMIPQTFSNVTIILKYNNGTTFSTTISGTWTAGNIYTYQLSKSTVYNFDYTGDVQTFTAPYTGIYKIECWGAQGGYAINETKACGGYGGMSSGRKHLIKGRNLYIVIGGQGGNVSNHSQTGSGGYNGGGKAIGDGATGWGGGGGATHIATVTGLLSTLSSQISQILIVAGGGGGGGYYDTTGHSPHSGGNGGGTTGDAGYSEADDGGAGGTQISGFAFGLGQDGKNSGYGSGGGGGYYGGYSGYTYGSAAGGGSGYIGGVDNGSFQTGARSGNGYARITFISAN